jgi:four helix bundle protein
VSPSVSTPTSKDSVYSDLEIRFAFLARDVLSLIKWLPRTTVRLLIENQLIRSVTSAGANYFEATECVTKKDKVSKLAISKKETKESKYWLLVLWGEFPKHRVRIEKLGKECQELVKILASIINKIS